MRRAVSVDRSCSLNYKRPRFYIAWVNHAVLRVRRWLPVYPDQQTSSASGGRSQTANSGLVRCSKVKTYSITSSARNVGGTLMPSCFAVLTLTTRMNLLA